MRNVKNITVAVSPELYHQTRMLAAQYQTTVTAMVAFLLERMPRLLKASRFPGPNPAPTALPATPTPLSQQMRFPPVCQ
jgi:hypothetical protein